MPAYKNQHFVPQMYLRLFAGADAKCIDVMPLKSGRIVHAASLKSQASRSWFYDTDGKVEHSLGIIEGAASKIIASIISRDRPPVRLSADHTGIIHFLALQHARTGAAADAENERLDKFMKVLFRHTSVGKEIVDQIDQVRATFVNPVGEAMRAAFLGTPLLYDLNMKLIVNTSGTPFIASDAPVIFHNQLCDGTGTPATGYANVGLQIILPLGPWRALICYDPRAYAVGSASSHVVKLVNPAHAVIINDLQWEVARDVMFLPCGVDEDQITNSWDRWRDKTKEQVSLGEEIVVDDKTKLQIRLGISRIVSTVKLNLPFIRKLHPSYSIWTGEEHIHVRHPEWVSHVQGLMALVEAGTLHPSRYMELTAKVPPNRPKFRP